ncbi:MAG: uroporphyrinogen-III synthase [Actinomycetaceae bacterium]|nr:uroporphyrinogen-III synthase [Actinomycetaceae bacterium]
MQIVLTRPDSPLVRELAALVTPSRVTAAALTRQIAVPHQLPGAPPQWVAITSPRTPQFLPAAVVRDWYEDGTQFACTGPATARALTQIGVRPREIPTHSSAAGLAAALTEKYAPAKLWFPGSAGASGVLVEQLRLAKWQVAYTPVYRTVALDTLPGVYEDAALIVVTAGSAARALAKLWSACPIPVVTIGEPSATTARTAGLTVVAVASEPTARALAECIKMVSPNLGDEDALLAPTPTPTKSGTNTASTITSTNTAATPTAPPA